MIRIEPFCQRLPVKRHGFDLEAQRVVHARQLEGDKSAILRPPRQVLAHARYRCVGERFVKTDLVPRVDLSVPLVDVHRGRMPHASEPVLDAVRATSRR